ncbi:MAG: hypothetical protein ACT6FG_02035 [Methanosarcinaceae archaeon]
MHGRLSAQAHDVRGLLADIVRSATGDATQTRVRIFRVPFEVNVRLDHIARRYITGHKKRIGLQGSVFTTLRAEFL